MHICVIRPQWVKLCRWTPSLIFQGPDNLTDLPLDKMADISQTIFSYAFWLIKSLFFIFKFLWSLFLGSQVIGLAYSVPSHYLNQCWPYTLTHICGTRGKWVKIPIVLVVNPQTASQSWLFLSLKPLHICWSRQARVIQRLTSLLFCYCRS